MIDFLMSTLSALLVIVLFIVVGIAMTSVIAFFTGYFWTMGRHEALLLVVRKRSQTQRKGSNGS